MYSTCIFCNRPLGENAVLEEFPVGRRLAFDPEKGRLWVVCRRCERWNLSPFEERWEAIEAAERLFRETRMRVSTENIGLARHSEGLELVRIGRPLRPEFAAWRYGDQFGRRRRRETLMVAGALGVIGTVAVVGVVTGAVGGIVALQYSNVIHLWRTGRTRVTLHTPKGETVRLRLMDLPKTRLRQTPDGEWLLWVGSMRMQHEFTGAEARRAAAMIMPHVNSAGARTGTVQAAVREIERLGGPEAFLSGALANPPKSALTSKYGGSVKLDRLPRPTRLALEMALHEEQERRALEGELEALELAWRAAEEIAAIADDLLIPDDLRRKLARTKDGV